MGTHRYSPRSGKARPILTERDYDAVQELLARWARAPAATVDWERVEALQHEVQAYEARFALSEPELAVEWVEEIYNQTAVQDALGVTRRWSDETAGEPTA